MKVTKSIRSQMTRWFSLLLVIPVALTFVYLYFMVQGHLQQTYMNHQQQMTEALAQEIGQWRFKFEDLTLQMFGDQLLQQALQIPSDESEARQLAIRQELRNRLFYYMELNAPIVGIYVLGTDGELFGRSNAITPDPQRFLIELMPETRIGQGRPVWNSHFSENTIIISRQIFDNKTELTRSIGYLFVFINRDALRKDFRQFALDPLQQFRLADSDGKVEVRLADVQQLPFEGKSPPIGRRYLESDQGQFVYYSAKIDDWLLSTWIDERLYNRPIVQVRIAVMVVAGALLVYFIVTILVLSGRIARPLRMIHKAMKQVGDGDLDIHVPVLRQDEVGLVANTLNRMSRRISGLMEMNRLDERRRRLLELRTLEYQINPHFLYNTLDSVNMMARKYDDQRIADIVTALSRLFRLGLNQGREMIRIDQEIEHARCYLLIQGIRFEEQLTWNIEVEPNIGDYQVIKFLLQPLVENSIMHGIRSRSRPGHVKIAVACKGGHAIFDVIDDGVGISEEKLTRLRADLEREMDEDSGSYTRTGGYGLWNVHNRLRLHFGVAYGIEINSRENEGTHVRIRIPVQKDTSDREDEN